MRSRSRADALRQRGAAPFQPGDGPLEPDKDCPLDDLRIRHLRTSDDIEHIMKLRRQIDLAAVASADPDFHAHERRKDELGLVLGFDLHGELIGTIRLMPVLFGLTLTEQLLAQVEPDFRARWPRSWDAGRLVMVPQYRTGQKVLKRCLHLVVLHLMAHTDAQYLLGSCTHILARLYRRMGFSFVAQNMPLAGTQKKYTLIHGPIPVVLHALASPTPDAAPEQSEARVIASAQACH
ncbi:MAG: hypothetical protein H0X13_02225 [Ramlibacter sp.]|nr:hypothetical protein [Ramlibacter sp.]